MNMPPKQRDTEEGGRSVNYTKHMDMITTKLATICICSNDSNISQGVPKERRRGRAEKLLSKRVFLESPFLLFSLKVCS